MWALWFWATETLPCASQPFQHRGYLLTCPTPGITLLYCRRSSGIHPDCWYQSQSCKPSPGKPCLFVRWCLAGLLAPTLPSNAPPKQILMWCARTLAGLQGCSAVSLQGAGQAVQQSGGCGASGGAAAAVCCAESSGGVAADGRHRGAPRAKGHRGQGVPDAEQPESPEPPCPPPGAFAGVSATDHALWQLQMLAIHTAA